MLCFAYIVRTQQTTQVTYCRLKHIQTRNSTRGKIDALDSLHRSFKLLVQPHDRQCVQRVHKRSTPLPEAVLEASCHRSDFILQPRMLLVSIPGMQEGVFHSGLSVESFCLIVLRLGAELMLDARDRGRGARRQGNC